MTFTTTKYHLHCNIPTTFSRYNYISGFHIIVARTRFYSASVQHKHSQVKHYSQSLLSKNPDSFHKEIRSFKFNQVHPLTLATLINDLYYLIPTLESDSRNSWCLSVQYLVDQILQLGLLDTIKLNQLIQVLLRRNIKDKEFTTRVAQSILKTKKKYVNWLDLAKWTSKNGIVDLTELVLSQSPTWTCDVNALRLLISAASSDKKIDIILDYIDLGISNKIFQNAFSDPAVLRSLLTAQKNGADIYNLFKAVSMNYQSCLDSTHFSIIVNELLVQYHAPVMAYKVLTIQLENQRAAESKWNWGFPNQEHLRVTMAALIENKQPNLVISLGLLLLNLNQINIFHLERMVVAYNLLGDVPGFLQLHSNIKLLPNTIALSVPYLTTLVHCLTTRATVRDPTLLTEALNIAIDSADVANNVVWSVLFREAMRLNYQPVLKAIKLHLLKSEVTTIIPTNDHSNNKNVDWIGLPTDMAFIAIVEPHLRPKSADIYAAVRAAYMIIDHRLKNKEHAAVLGPLGISKWAAIMGSILSMKTLSRPKLLGLADAIHTLAVSHVGGTTVIKNAVYKSSTIATLSNLHDNQLAHDLVCAWVMNDYNCTGIENTIWDHRIWRVPPDFNDAHSSKVMSPALISICIDTIGFANRPDTLSRFLTYVRWKGWQTDANVWASVVEAWSRLGDGEKAITALMHDMPLAKIKLTPKVLGTFKTMIAKDPVQLGWVLLDQRVTSILSNRPQFAMTP